MIIIKKIRCLNKVKEDLNRLVMKKTLLYYKLKQKIVKTKEKKYSNYFLLKSPLLSKKGSTIISALIAVGIMSTSVLALTQYMGSFHNQQSKTIERISIAPLLKKSIIYNMRSLLITDSICQLIVPPSTSTGVTPVKLMFKNTRGSSDPESIANIFTNNQWKKFFPAPQWKKNTNANSYLDCQSIDSNFDANNPLHSCFEYYHSGKKYSETSSSNNNRPKTYVVVRITPSQFPDYVAITNNNSHSYSPMSVAFLLSASIGVISPDENAQAYVNYISDIVWSNESNECKIEANDGNYALVKLSTASIVSNNPNIISDSSILTNIPQGCMKLTFSGLNANIVQAGQLDNLDISALLGYNVRASCNKNQFQCIKDSSPSNYDDFKLEFSVTNYGASPIILDQLNFTFVDSNGREIDNGDDEKLKYSSNRFSEPIFQITSSDKIIRNGQAINDHTSKNVVGNQILNPGSELIVPPGTHAITMTVPNPHIKSSCDSICQSLDTANPSTFTYPAVTFHEKGNTGCVFNAFSSNTSNPNNKNWNKPSHKTHCTVCHKKACHSFGLGTFGPKEDDSNRIDSSGVALPNLIGLGTESLDSAVPECSVDHYFIRRNLKRKRRIPASVKGPGDSSTVVKESDACKAMVMDVVDINSFKNFTTNTYTAKNCSETKPILCFVAGNYAPAIEVDSNGNINLIQDTFDKAQKYCYEQGRENGTYWNLFLLFNSQYSSANFTNIFNSITSLFGSSAINGKTIADLSDLPGNVPNPNQDIKYDFINNATRGMFFAPSNHTITRSFKTTLVNILQKVYNKEVWVGLEYDAEGSVVASVPWAKITGDYLDNPWAVLFRKGDETQGEGDTISLVLHGTSANLPSSLNSSQRLQYQAKVDSPSPIPNGDKKFFQLVNDFRYRGLLDVTKQGDGYTNTIVGFLCKSTGLNRGSFKFVNASNPKIEVEDAYKACRRNQGMFVPPVTSLEWAQALLAVNAHDSNYGFPSPFPAIANASTYFYIHNKPLKKAWVALESIGDLSFQKGPKAKDLRMASPGIFIDEEDFPWKYLDLDLDSIFAPRDPSYKILNTWTEHNKPNPSKILGNNPLEANETYRIDQNAVINRDIAKAMFLKTGQAMIDGVGVPPGGKIHKPDFGKNKTLCLRKHNKDWFPDRTVLYGQPCPSGTESLYFGRKEKGTNNPVKAIYIPQSIVTDSSCTGNPFREYGKDPTDPNNLMSKKDFVEKILPRINEDMYGGDKTELISYDELKFSPGSYKYMTIWLEKVRRGDRVVLSDLEEYKFSTTNCHKLEPINPSSNEPIIDLELLQLQQRVYKKYLNPNY